MYFYNWGADISKVTYDSPVYWGPPYIQTNSLDNVGELFRQSLQFEIFLTVLSQT